MQTVMLPSLTLTAPTLAAWSVSKNADFRVSTLHFRVSSLRCSLISSAARVSRSAMMMGGLCGALPLECILGYGGAAEPPCHNTLRLGVTVLSPEVQPLTASTAEHPVQGLVGNLSPPAGSSSYHQGGSGCVSLSLSFIVSHQQRHGFITAQLAGLSHHTVSKLQTVKLSDKAAAGGHVAKLAGDTVADLKTGHGSEIGRESGWLPMPVSYSSCSPLQPPDRSA